VRPLAEGGRSSFIWGWKDPRALSSTMRSLPAHVSMSQDSAIVAPGAVLECPSGTLTFSLDIPDYGSLARRVEILHGELIVLEISETDLDPGAMHEVATGVGSGASIDIIGRKVPIAATDMELSVFAISPGHGRIVVKNLSTTSTASAAELVLTTPTMPRRSISLPLLPPGEAHLIEWHETFGITRRAYVLPVDEDGRLLARFLNDRRYRYSSAAARQLERVGGELDPLSWVRPSYRQLLVGYSYALSQDTERLDCTDGIVLAAESERHSNGLVAAASTLSEAVGCDPPSLIYGGDLALDIATRVVSSSSEGSDAYDRLSSFTPAMKSVLNNWLPIMVKADSTSATLSVPETGSRVVDLSAAPLHRRLAWLLRYLVTRWRYDVRIGAKSMEAGGKTRIVEVAVATGDRKPIWRTLLAGDPSLAVLYWLGVLLVGLLLIIRSESNSTATWILVGALQAGAFIVLGYTLGSSSYRSRAKSAESRALKAEDLAEKFRDDAMRGRALAAALQVEALDADEPEPQVIRHAQLSRGLLGEMVLRKGKPRLD
jgi:hypothetical protein